MIIHLISYLTDITGLCHTKRSLMSWVVIPKGRARVPHLMWHRLFRFFSLFLKSRCHTKRRMGACGMTTQDIGDLFAWRRPCFPVTYNFVVMFHLLKTVNIVRTSWNLEQVAKHLIVLNYLCALYCIFNI